MNINNNAKSLVRHEVPENVLFQVGEIGWGLRADVRLLRSGHQIQVSKISINMKEIASGGGGVNHPELNPCASLWCSHVNPARNNAVHYNEKGKNYEVLSPVF